MLGRVRRAHIDMYVQLIFVLISLDLRRRVESSPAEQQCRLLKSFVWKSNHFRDELQFNFSEIQIKKSYLKSFFSGSVFWKIRNKNPKRGTSFNFRPNIYEVNPDLLEILYPIKRSPRPDFGTGRGLSGVDYSINANGVIHLYKALGRKLCTNKI